MRYFIPFLLLFGIHTINAQRILNAGELCAANRMTTFGGNISDARSDTFDLLHTQLRVDLSDFANKKITAVASIAFLTKIEGAQNLRLDLEGLVVDSVKADFALANWNYNGKAVYIQAATPLVVQQPHQVTIYYRGSPIQDATGWGGFYWSGAYVYNLGVGFAADPHSFGRAWFPCFDNFVERCSFETIIVAAADKPSFANGRLTEDKTLPSGLHERTWVLDEAIPSYLACIAAGPYINWTRTLTGESGSVPVQIAVAAADSTKLNNSFLHLPQALAAYEYWYGPYRWNKIGYTVVPFNSGAMEHATNIAYMRPAVDGTLAYETLYAHELSHHWWGDLATCTTAEDMWLNEGWASFSEHLFLEWVYGRTRYVSTVQANFLDVIQNAHVNEGGYRAVSGLPHAYTYGDHVYRKGAIVAHNLRGYMGDSLFRQGIKSALDNTQFDDWSSAEFRDQLNAATGLDLTHFFNNWVFSPGFIDLTVDSFEVITPAIDTFKQIKVAVTQRRRGAPAFFTNMPVELTFVGADGSRAYRTGVFSGEKGDVTFDFPLSFNCVRVWADTRSKLTLARAVFEKKITTTGSQNADPAKMMLKINAVQDSALLRIEHHFSTPDTSTAANPNQYLISNRFWTVDGIWPDGLSIEATLIYDGRGNLDQLDRELFEAGGASETDVRLLYRPGVGHPWAEATGYTKNVINNAADRWGQLKLSLLQRGEYTIGKGGISGTEEVAPDALPTVTLHPNPAVNSITIQSKNPLNTIQLFDSKGSLVFEQSALNQQEYTINIANLVKGNYQVIATLKNGQRSPLNFIKQ